MCRSAASDAMWWLDSMGVFFFDNLQTDASILTELVARVILTTALDVLPSCWRSGF